MDRVVVRFDDRLRPGAWALRGRQPVHRCPGCGEITSLANHAVGVNGEVVSPLACLATGCQFQASAVLNGWRHGAKAAAAAVTP